MDIEKFLLLDIEELKVLHEQSVSRLTQALLDGADWQSVQDYRHEITELEIAIFKRTSVGDVNPAEGQNRITS
jgi:hypothetical protein